VRLLIIVLDTNILCKDFYMQGAQLSLLRQLGGIVIPEIVFDEILNKHREVVEKNGNELIKKVEEYQKVTHVPIAVNVSDCYSEEHKLYEQFLINILLENSAYPPEGYPQVSHKEVVKRSLLRKKPFKVDGRSGYRDYLVWRTVLDIVKQSEEDVHFISENTADFGDGQDKRKLHPDLLDEMKELGIDGTRLQYWGLLKDFIEDVVKPSLTVIEEEQSFINKLSASKEFQTIKDIVHKKLVGFGVSGYDVFVPGDSLFVRKIFEWNDIEIYNVAKLKDGKVLVSVNAKCFAEIQSSTTKMELASLTKEDMMDSSIEEKDNKNIVIYTAVLLDVELEVIYDDISDNICSVDITDVSDSAYCEYCPYD